MCAKSRQTEQRHPPLPQLAQPFPPPREVPGKKQHEQDLDYLDRLHGSEVYTRVVTGRAGSERGQCGEQHESGDQRRVDQPGVTAVVEKPEQRQEQQRASDRDAEDKLAKLERIPQRIAKAERDRESNSRQQMQRRENGAVTREPALAPDEVDEVERSEEDRDP